MSQPSVDPVWPYHIVYIYTEKRQRLLNFQACFFILSKSRYPVLPCTPKSVKTWFKCIQDAADDCFLFLVVSSSHRQYVGWNVCFSAQVWIAASSASDYGLLSVKILICWKIALGRHDQSRLWSYIAVSCRLFCVCSSGMAASTSSGGPRMVNPRDSV